MTPAPTARDVALDAMVRIDDGAFSHVLLPTMLRRSALSAADRGQVTALVYGTLRGRGRCDHLLEQVLDRPLDALEVPVRAGLRLGVQQLITGVPAHAAVGETVEAIGRVRPKAKGFANGVLRSVARLGPDWPWPRGDDDAALAVRTSHPEWIVRRFREDLGPDAALAILEADDETPALTLRVNRNRATVAEVRDELEVAGVHVEVGHLAPDALVVRGTGDPRALPAVRDGRATPQDEGSQAVVVAVDARPGERVLDIAAAPGGKTTGLAEAMGGHGLVAAGDRYAGRTRLVRDAAVRLGLADVRTFVADGRALPFAPGSFDRVLLDAPCSGLGVLRRRAETRWRLSPDDPELLAELQRDLVVEAAAMVRPGGTLVYSVCTLTSPETLGVDDHVAAVLPDWAALEIPGVPWIPHGRGALLRPDAVGSDSMFLLRLLAPGAPG
ncbi:MAG: 16S rRNA (cytosine(967)-C(5))-methyltransferase RsmB [Actinomycetes bacterium]